MHGHRFKTPLQDQHCKSSSSVTEIFPLLQDDIGSAVLATLYNKSADGVCMLHAWLILEASVALLYFIDIVDCISVTSVTQP